MLQLKNNTPFEASLSLFPNEKGIDTLYVLLKATIAIGKEQKVAEEQLPVVMADEYWGEPGESSIKYASEMHLSKQTTDVVLIGEACAPDLQQIEEADVVLSVGDRSKMITVFGDRYWENSPVGMKMTEPEPFESMPFIYEYAFGGTHELDPEKGKVFFEERNPIGVGFRGKRGNSEMDGMPLPNLEDADQLITKPSDVPQPAGFGFVAPFWLPRKQYAGTYDEAWQKHRAPFLPDDFDARYFNAAHPDFIFDRFLTGGEPVEIVHMSPEGNFSFNLPEWEFDPSVRIAGKKKQLQFNLETVLFEPSDLRFSMLWRAEVACDKKALKVEQVDIGLQRFDLGKGVIGV